MQIELTKTEIWLITKALESYSNVMVKTMENHENGKELIGPREKEFIIDNTQLVDELQTKMEDNLWKLY